MYESLSVLRDLCTSGLEAPRYIVNSDSASRARERESIDDSFWKTLILRSRACNIMGGSLDLSFGCKLHLTVSLIRHYPRVHAVSYIDLLLLVIKRSAFSLNSVVCVPLSQRCEWTILIGMRAMKNSPIHDSHSLQFHAAESVMMSGYDSARKKSMCINSSNEIRPAMCYELKDLCFSL